MRTAALTMACILMLAGAFTTIPGRLVAAQGDPCGCSANCGGSECSCTGSGQCGCGCVDSEGGGKIALCGCDQT